MVRSRFKAYGVAAIVLLVLDGVWLGLVSPPLYRMTIGSLLRDVPNLPAAALFYALFVVGVVEFVVVPEPPGAPLGRCFARGLLFGLVAYATFDLTAMAVVRGWSWRVTFADMAWGSLLTGIVAVVTRRLTRGADNGKA
jgi:uncharacterized membrane protein